MSLLNLSLSKDTLLHDDRKATVSKHKNDVDRIFFIMAIFSEFFHDSQRIDLTMLVIKKWAAPVHTR